MVGSCEQITKKVASGICVHSHHTTPSVVAVILGGVEASSSTEQVHACMHEREHKLCAWLYARVVTQLIKSNPKRTIKNDSDSSK